MTPKRSISFFFLVVALLLVTGCDLVPLHMRDQPRYEPMQPSTFWENGMASRPIPPNTVPRGDWGLAMQDPVYFTGRLNEQEFVQTIPAEVTRDMLERGQERFNIFCAPCHAETGYGDGMIVQRGFKAPPSLHDQRLRDEADGYIYDVITNGFGAMYSYASRVPPDDRWAIVAYVRALQYSQNVNVDDLPDETRQDIESQLE
jgi:mono/diheme cytochrome c family protein